MNRESQATKLAACDEDLAQIAADVTDLHLELQRLREHGEALARQVADGEAMVGERDVALVRLEQARTDWQQRAEAAAIALGNAEAGLAALNREVAVREEQLQLLREWAADEDRLRDFHGSDAAAAGHVLMVGLSTGYHLRYSDDPCPPAGERLAIDGWSYTVERTGRSPLPGDGRPCAFVVPATR